MISVAFLTPEAGSRVGWLAGCLLAPPPDPLLPPEPALPGATFLQYIYPRLSTRLWISL